MIEYGIRLPSPPHRVIVGPGCGEADVAYSLHGHPGLIRGSDHGQLVRRIDDGPWEPVR